MHKPSKGHVCLVVKWFIYQTRIYVSYPIKKKGGWVRPEKVGKYVWGVGIQKEL